MVRNTPGADAVFAESCLEHLDDAEHSLLNLEASLKDRDPIDLADIEAVFRAIHTVKGDAKSHGREDVITAAHHMETLLAAIRERRVVFTRSIATGLLEQLDRLRELFT